MSQVRVVFRYESWDGRDMEGWSRLLTRNHANRLLQRLNYHDWRKPHDRRRARTVSLYGPMGGSYPDGPWCREVTS